MGARKMESERIERFWKKVNIKGPDDCWFWAASVNSKGYGSFAIDVGKLALSHRISWALAKNDGVLPNPKHPIMHSCDVKRCVNPSHLEIGTTLQNNRDARARGLVTNYIPSEQPTCRHGHPRTPENTHPKYNTCLPCVEVSNAKAYAKRDKKKYADYHRLWREANKEKKKLYDQERNSRLQMERERKK
jgi:hypothetical protein